MRYWGWIPTLDPDDAVRPLPSPLIDIDNIPLAIISGSLSSEGCLVSPIYGYDEKNIIKAEF